MLESLFGLNTKAHQPVAKVKFCEAQCLQRKIQRIAGDLPKVGMSSLSGSERCVLQLFVTPKRSQSDEAASFPWKQPSRLFLLLQI